MTMFGDMVFQFGGAPVGTPFFSGANHFFVDPVNGNDANSGKKWGQALKTLSAAHNKCTAGNNDVVYLIGNGATSGTARESSSLIWSKDATHLIGIAAPTRVAARARMSSQSGVTFTPLVTFSADGCYIANIHFYQDYNTAAANTCIAMTGQRNYFYNCHIAGGGGATGAAHASCTSMTLAGDGENTFENCTIGLDTVSSGATAAATIAFSSAAVRNQFINCDIIKFAGDATSLFVTANASGALDRFTIFRDCNFINAVRSTATGMTAAFAVHASAGGMILVIGGSLVGATDWTAADNANVYLCGFHNAGSGNLNTGIAHTVDVS